jgi:hypothetical protein
VEHGCITLALDKHRRPIQVSTFRWSSAETAWVGFPVESHVVGPRGELGEFGLDHALLGLCVGGAGELQVQYGKAARRITSLPGRFSLLGSGFEQKPVTWTGVREMLFVAIGAEQLEHLIGQDPNVHFGGGPERRFLGPESSLTGFPKDDGHDAQAVPKHTLMLAVDGSIEEK